MSRNGRTAPSGWSRGQTIAVRFLAALAGLAWVGLRVKPAPFPPVGEYPVPEETISMPAGLPAPVERFYRAAYGERIPVIDTAVITGRGTMRLFGLTFPARFRFTHDAGRSYRHYFELTFFGLPVMKANEHYVDGKERMELPMGVQENNPKLDQGGNLGMWAEILRWLPASLLTTAGVRWEPVDANTALLVVPFRAEEERFVVRFEPSSGEVSHWEVMRYKNGAGEKTLWVNGAWVEDGGPWAVFDSDEIAYNVEVDTSVDAKGP